MREFAYWWGDIQFYRCCLSEKLKEMRGARNAIIALKNLGFEPEYFDQMITCFFDIFAYLQRYDEDFQKFRLTEQFKHNKRKRKHSDAEGDYNERKGNKEDYKYQNNKQEKENNE